MSIEIFLNYNIIAIFAYILMECVIFVSLHFFKCINNYCSVWTFNTVVKYEIIIIIKEINITMLNNVKVLPGPDLDNSYLVVSIILQIHAPNILVQVNLF